MAAIDPEDIGYRAGRRAVTPLGGAPLPTRRRQRRSSSRRSSRSCCGCWRRRSPAMRWSKGRSLFTDRPGIRRGSGTQIGSAAVDLVDDGTLAGRSGTSPFDGEGVPTRRTPLIEGGVLRGFLHNCESAQRAGRRSTGNGDPLDVRGLPEVGADEPGAAAWRARPGRAGGERGRGAVRGRDAQRRRDQPGQRRLLGGGFRAADRDAASLRNRSAGVTLAAPMLELLCQRPRGRRGPALDQRPGGHRRRADGLIDDVTIGGR